MFEDTSLFSPSPGMIDGAESCQDVCMALAATHFC